MINSHSERIRNMRETPTDIDTLQHCLTQSIERAGPFLRESFQMPTCSLSARQLIRYFDSIKNIALATVTARGAPRVAPIGAMLLRGQLYIPTVATAARTKHVHQRPAVSLTHFVGSDLAIIVHGQAIVITSSQLLFTDLEDVQHTLTGQSVRDWGDGVYLQIIADVIYTFARQPNAYPE
jgi:hypothetical protein